MTTKAKFKIGEHVVYPAHGVGKVTGKEEHAIGELSLDVYVIEFEREKMVLRVPMTSAAKHGLRPISSKEQLEKALATLKQRARVGRGMWSRRAQEFENKINSGDVVAIAEVVRDLHRNVDQSERSYSERMIYESAMNRLIGELAAAQKLESEKAHGKLLDVLKTQAA